MQEHHTLPTQSELIICHSPDRKTPEICQKIKPNQNHAHHTARWTLRFVGQKLADAKGTIWKKEIQNFEHYSKCSSTSFLVYFLIVQYMQAIPQYTNTENAQYTNTENSRFYMELRLSLLQKKPYFLQKCFNIEYQLLCLKLMFVSQCKKPFIRHHHYSSVALLTPSPRWVSDMTNVDRFHLPAQPQINSQSPFPQALLPLSKTIPTS